MNRGRIVRVSARRENHLDDQVINEIVLPLWSDNEKPLLVGISTLWILHTLQVTGLLVDPVDYQGVCRLDPCALGDKSQGAMKAPLTVHRLGHYYVCISSNNHRVAVAVLDLVHPRNVLLIRFTMDNVA